MKRIVISAFLSVGLSAAALAQTPNPDLNQIQLRYSECAAFFYAGAVGFKAYDKREEADVANSQAHAALELAVSIGVKIGLSETEMNHRLQSAEIWVMQRAGNDLANYDTLMEEMGPRCLELLQYPPSALFEQPVKPTEE